VADLLPLGSDAVKSQQHDESGKPAVALGRRAALLVGSDRGLRRLCFRSGRSLCRRFARTRRELKHGRRDQKQASIPYRVKLRAAHFLH
jgi:hypothetical protein